MAYNAETGEKLWKMDLNGENVAPVTYMLDGKQYVSVLARSHPNRLLCTFVLDGKEPVAPLAPRP
jgi:glucose dehydrogenase